MDYCDASICGIGDFTSGDQLAQLNRGRTEEKHKAIFGDAKHRGNQIF